MTKFKIWSIAILLIIIGCDQKPEKVADSKDYEKYLRPTVNKVLASAENERNFWHRKLQDHPEHLSYFSPLAAAYSSLFEVDGNIDHLLMAAKLLEKGNIKTNYKEAGLLRSLARNYISQHRFKESLELLEKAYSTGVKRHLTEKMLFDVYLELGDYDKAEVTLDQIKNRGGFDYLIRMSKWMDYKGNLDRAIHYMRMAKDLAVESKKDHLIYWSYSNLADYYGHAGKVQEAYNLYLKVLEMNPNYTYALKGIAWIAFSHDRDAVEANRVIDAISKYYFTPDLHLFKAELAEYNADLVEKERNLKQYIDMLDRGGYSQMYNKYNALLYAEDLQNTDKAKEIAHEEIKNRPTPQSYDLLAWAYYNEGNLNKSLEIIQDHVVDKTFEPEVEYHQAQIYKANGLNDEAMELKRGLLKSAFELGPNMQRKIEML